MAEVEQERRGAVHVIRINRPEARNSLNAAVITGIGLGMVEADADPEVRAIVLTATGDRAFCAGMDLRGFAAGTSAEAGPDDERGRDGFTKFVREGFSTPVIGAANATAVAGGLELLLGCDMVVASSAAKFGVPEVKRGLFPAGGGVFLTRRIPMAMAYELILTGDTVSADRALQLGLVNYVVPPEQVLDEAMRLAEAIAANGPLGVQAAKQLARAAATRTPEEVWALQETLQPGVFGSEDAKEGATAFVEKRAPVWRGR